MVLINQKPDKGSVSVQWIKWRRFDVSLTSVSRKSTHWGHPVSSSPDEHQQEAQNEVDRHKRSKNRPGGGDSEPCNERDALRAMASGWVVRPSKEGKRSGEDPDPGKFENGVHRVTFPLFGREENDVRLRVDARIPCPSSRRIERKETLKKKRTGSLFSLGGSRLGSTWPRRFVLLYRTRGTFDRILNFSSSTNAGALLTNVNRRLG